MPSTDARPVLNPLALTPVTNAWFLLLAAGALAAATTAGSMIDRFIGWSPASRSVVDTSTLEAAASTFNDLTGARELIPVALTVPWIAALALWRYATHPRRLERALGLSAPDPVRDRALVAEVHALAARAGLRVAVRIGAGGHQANGQAFGVLGTPRIALDRGMRLLFRKDPARARVIVQHEIGHLQSGDVWRSYLGDALWWAAAWGALLPLGAVMIVYAGWGALQGVLEQGLSNLVSERRLTAGYRLLRELLQIAGLGLLITLARAALLRSRELYADAYAARAGGAEALRALFAGVEERGRGWLALHPSASERAEAVDDPTRLLRGSLWLDAGVGAVVAQLIGTAVSVWGYLAMLASDWLAARALRTATGGPASLPDELRVALLRLGVVEMFLSQVALLAFVLLPMVPVAWLVARTLGVRATEAAVLEDLGQARWSALQRALALFMGFEVGMWLLPLSTGLPQHPLGWVAAALVGVAGVGLMAVVLRTARALGRFAITRSTATRAPTWRLRFAGVVLTVLCGLALVPVAGLRLVLVVTDAEATPGLLLDSAIGLGGLLVVLVLLGGSAALAMRVVASRVCPKCRAVHRPGPLIGRRCGRCAAPLTPWVAEPSALALPQS